MDKLVLKSYAKINLTLDVLGREENGYHNLDMIMQNIDLYDTLTFEKNNSNNIEIVSNNYRLQKEGIKKNIIYRCIEKTFDYCNYKGNRGIKITLNKTIPLEAGLAGGSSNGATSIKAINKIYNFNLTIDDMMNIGKTIGSDIPFCLVGGTARVRGLGEKVEILKPHMKANILLIKPNVSISTKYIFESLNLCDIKYRPNTLNMINAIEDNNLSNIGKELCNVLEVVTIKKYGIIEEIKGFMLDNKSLGSIMTGSGSAVFGYFEDEKTLKYCANKMKNKFQDILIFETSINNFKGREIL